MLDFGGLSVKVYDFVSNALDVMDPSKVAPKDLTALSDLAINLSRINSAEQDYQVNIYLKSDKSGKDGDEYQKISTIWDQ